VQNFHAKHVQHTSTHNSTCNIIFTSASVLKQRVASKPFKSVNLVLPYMSDSK